MMMIEEKYSTLSFSRRGTTSMQQWACTESPTHSGNSQCWRNQRIERWLPSLQFAFSRNVWFWGRFSWVCLFTKALLYRRFSWVCLFPTCFALKVICHATAWDFYDGEDFRIRMCTQEFRCQWSKAVQLKCIFIFWIDLCQTLSLRFKTFSSASRTWTRSTMNLVISSTSNNTRPCHRWQAHKSNLIRIAGSWP